MLQQSKSPTAKMILKRKRSDSEISTSSTLLSFPLFAHHPSWDQPQNQLPTPSLFASRTRKRSRDNRPSEAEVYQHTLSLLFSAQQNPSPPPEPIQPCSALVAPPFPREDSSQQSSLYSFFHSSTRHSSPVSRTHTPTIIAGLNAYFRAAACEDCNAPLSRGAGLDGDGDMDVDMEGGSGCTSCGKEVCCRCSVSNLDAERRCLNCAGRREDWAGDVGWGVSR